MINVRNTHRFCDHIMLAFYELPKLALAGRHLFAFARLKIDMTSEHLLGFLSTAMEKPWKPNYFINLSCIIDEGNNLTAGYVMFILNQYIAGISFPCSHSFIHNSAQWESSGLSSQSPHGYSR